MFSFFKSKPSGIAVTPDKIYDAIRRDHRQIDPLGKSTIRLADTKYLTVTEDEARKFILKSASFYTPQLNDCDDHAWMAKAEAIRYQQRGQAPLAFGVLWTETHALNWYMDYGFKIRLIDQEQSTGVLTHATLWLA